MTLMPIPQLEFPLTQIKAVCRTQFAIATEE